MAATNSELTLTDAAEWAQGVRERGYSVSVGPLSTLIPASIHKYVSRETLKSYIADTEEVAEELRKKNEPADIPVIVKAYTEELYSAVNDKLNDLGKLAAEQIHPWVLNTIIDWDNVDKVICDGADDDDGTEEEDSADKPSTSEESNHTFKWSEPRVNLLIDLHTKYEDLLHKPGVKKASVWNTIAHEINQTVCSEKVARKTTGKKAEQKWMNMTYKFRACVDHNKQSGNDRKECPYFDKLQTCYGY